MVFDEVLVVESAKPKVITFMASLLVLTRGQKNSFQVHKNLIITRAARDGLIEGRMIRKRCPAQMNRRCVLNRYSHRESLAASRIKNTPKALTNWGSISPTYVLIKPNFTTH